MNRSEVIICPFFRLLEIEPPIMKKSGKKPVINIKAYTGYCEIDNNIFADYDVRVSKKKNKENIKDVNRFRNLMREMCEYECPRLYGIPSDYIPPWVEDEEQLNDNCSNASNEDWDDYDVHPNIIKKEIKNANKEN